MDGTYFVLIRLQTKKSFIKKNFTDLVYRCYFQVGEVCDFIRNLPGCADYAEDFAIQEIDGQALMLLKEDHLMSAMSIKLGPALKIVAKIDSMRMDSTTSPTPVAGGPV